MPEPPKKAKKKRRFNAPPDAVLSDDEKDFLANLQRGHATEELVELRLRDAGLDVTVAPLSTELAAVDDQADIIVGGKIILEVKGRRLRFTGAWDYPYKTIMIGSEDRWKRRRTKPDAVVVVSEITGAAIAYWTSDPEKWAQVMLTKTYNRHHDREEISYAVPRKGWTRWTDFVEQLREKTQ